MGVKGLRSFLRQRIKVSRRILSAGSTLVIDGDGWMFHLLQQCKGKLNMDTGGSYEEFASVVLAEVNRLKSYDLELVVLFDGPKNPLKDRTTIERLKRREREWASLHQFYSTESIPHNPEDFPIAPLCKEQLMAALDLCSVRHLHCINEAEQEIALLVQQQNLLCTPDTRCFAYGQDTDYIVMTDCPYIEFGAIEVDEAGKPSAEVWSRIEVCRGLTISEEQFLDFVLFLGNDRTAPLVVHTDLYATMNRSFQGNVSMIMQAWLENLSNQQPEIGPLQAADLFRLLSASDNASRQDARLKQIAELQCAMDYSRALYNLEPLNHFYELASGPQGVEESLGTSGFSSACIQEDRSYENVRKGALLTNVAGKGAPASPLTSSVPHYKPVRGSESFSRNSTAFKREPWSNGSRSNDARNIREPYKPSVHRSHYLAGSEAYKPQSGEGEASGKPPLNAYERLPIDEHREKILSQIQSNRVTIIHGETGCGKSSRLPHFLLEDAEASDRPCKIFVSQPRRISIIGMLKRLRPVLGDKVGMRMGYCVRDETEDTKINYVTTGYLVKLMAHRPEALRRCTHIVIDEVHERSVEGDLICLLVRDLLLRFSQLRVILMSATINTDLYRDYFSQYDDGSFGIMDCLSVGVKRFSVKIHYLEDLCKRRSNNLQQLAVEVSEEKPLTTSWSEAQYRLVVALLRSVCPVGTTVIVFASGLVDISAIAELLETSPQFLVCPLHSTTPDEEQEFVFEPTPPCKVKVVIATNIAESSVTIPDCDVVICLGTHKTNCFNESLQSTNVTLSLLSKASAAQRAGRTGRVRPGTVYRLYTKETYQKMREHELAEVLRRPLDDVMLNMWTVLENAEDFQGVTPFLQKLIEVPDMSCVETSFQKLCSASLITFPSDKGILTPAGRFVSSLPLNLSLGRMLSYGVLLGVPAEAIVIAASLSMSQTHPYRMANAFFHEPSQFNNQIRKRFLSELHFDQGDYSEPIARIRLLLEWRGLGTDSARNRFCHQNNLQFKMMTQFESTAVSLADHLFRFQQTQCPSVKRVNISSIGPLTSSTINILRLIMVWAFSENIIQLERMPERLEFIRDYDGAFEIESDRVTEQDMKTLFGPISYALKEYRPRQIYTVDHEFSVEPDSYLCLVQLVNRLSIVATSYDTQCFAVFMETIEEDQLQVVMVVLPGENFELLTHAFQSYIQHGICNLGDQFAERLTGDCFCISDSMILACLDATQSEAGDVYDLLCSVPDSLIIHVADNMGCLESIDTPLNPAQVAAIFGVIADSDDADDVFIMDEPPEKITMLEFPKEDRVGTSLIDDLPLGHRLVQCCRSTRKDYKLVLPQKKSEIVQNDQIDAKWMEEPYKARRAKNGPQREVSVESVHPVWHLSSGDKRYVAKLPWQGMMSTSFHCGAKPLFAVAHKALPNTNMAGTIFAMNGVTFLPTNPLWMQLALCVAGKDPIKVEENTEEGENESENETTGESLLQLIDAARGIGQLLTGASNFERRDDIIDGVHSLFRHFSSDPGSGEKVGVSGELGSSKVVTLPPSALKAAIPPRLSSDDMRVNQKHGYDPANDYKMAHEVRKRAAPVTAPPATHKILPESTAPESISKEGTTVLPKHQHCVDSKFGTNEEGEEGEWEANVESFSARVRCASFA